MAKIISSERARHNTRNQVLTTLEIISLRLAEQRKELIQYVAENDLLQIYVVK